MSVYSYLPLFLFLLTCWSSRRCCENGYGESENGTSMVICELRGRIGWG